MRRYLARLLLLFLISLFLFSLTSPSRAAQDCTKFGDPELNKLCHEINQLERDLEFSQQATQPLEAELARLEGEIDRIQARINQIGAETDALEASIFEREVNLAFQQELLAARVRSFYIRSQLYSPLLLLLSSGTASELTRELSYRVSAANEDRRIIRSISEEIIQLEADKERLASERAGLSSLQANLDPQAQFLSGEIQSAKAYQAQLSSKIAALTARQQQIIAQKLGSLNLPPTLGAGPLFCVDDRDSKYDPGFRPALAFYTFGIPHRVGMNQYGAYGRANAGQNHEEILRAYFDNINFETRPNIDITVDGYGTMPLETYLLGIYEMPESWNLEALKAQAIAARSYALAYTNNGANSICTSQKCQVYRQPHKTGNWKSAVEQTADKVMISGGQVIKAWYASTAGGYTFNSGDVWGSPTPWTKRFRDTTGDVANFSDLLGAAYDRESRCFYSAQGWRKQYNGSAWLKSEEVADIANVILLARADSSTREHLYQTDKPHPYGGEVWNEERVKQELRNRGMNPLNSVTSVSVTGVDWGSGITTGIQASGDAGTQTFSGSEFKDWFNLRAPANIQIVGPLFNVEHK